MRGCRDIRAGDLGRDVLGIAAPSRQHQDLGFVSSDVHLVVHLAITSAERCARDSAISMVAPALTVAVSSAYVHV